MSRQEFERNYGAVTPIDICHACGALWFDTWEDLTLTPGSVLRLFVVINDNQPTGLLHTFENRVLIKRRGRPEINDFAVDVV